MKIGRNGIWNVDGVAHQFCLPQAMSDAAAFYAVSLRAIDARLRGESYSNIAEILLGFRGTKEAREAGPRKKQARRLIAHGLKMVRGGYRLLLHYPIQTGKR